MKILVISLAGIGDTLFATPLIHELRLNFPKARIEALVMWPGAKHVLEGNPYLDEVHQKNLIKASFPGALRFLWGLRRGHYAVSLNSMPQSRLQYRLVARYVGAASRISHSYDRFTWLDRALLTHTLEQDYSIHCVENNLALLPLAGARQHASNHAYEVYLTDEEHRWAAEFLRQHELAEKTLLGIHVGSGGTKNLALRRWPLAHYQELIRQLNDTLPEARVLLFGGPEEARDHEALLGVLDRKRVFAPETKNLRQAAALVAKCELFLSVDTALMHVAAAMKVPRQIVIETPTWNRTVEPYRRPYVLVPNAAVAGRNLEFYRYDGHGIQAHRSEIIRCMESISPADVFMAVRQALGQPLPKEE